MPGPHLDMKLMQSWPAVGGCDFWLGGYWSPKRQWWTGWHTSRDYQHWEWPSADWVLIGYELWDEDGQLVEAMYVSPNPSTTSGTAPPNGHVHLKWNRHGQQLFCRWSDEILVDDHPYLKGGRFGPKGTGKSLTLKGNDVSPKGQGKTAKGKGKDTGPKGKGQGKISEGPGAKDGKGKGKGF